MFKVSEIPESSHGFDMENFNAVLHSGEHFPGRCVPVCVLLLVIVSTEQLPKYGTRSTTFNTVPSHSTSPNDSTFMHMHGHFVFTTESHDNISNCFSYNCASTVDDNLKCSVKLTKMFTYYFKTVEVTSRWNPSRQQLYVTHPHMFATMRCFNNFCIFATQCIIIILPFSMLPNNAVVL